MERMSPPILQCRRLCSSTTMLVLEIRPAKRRRIVEITDSLISTAFSAAVIGTAVGLTAYRLYVHLYRLPCIISLTM
jgi:hypothetical protein